NPQAAARSRRPAFGSTCAASGRSHRYAGLVRVPVTERCRRPERVIVPVKNGKREQTEYCQVGCDTRQAAGCSIMRIVPGIQRLVFSASKNQGIGLMSFAASRTQLGVAR